jgi:hypothetical protein
MMFLCLGRDATVHQIQSAFALAMSMWTVSKAIRTQAGHWLAMAKVLWTDE